MSPRPLLRSPLSSELERLTRIALAAKAHWGYPQDWLDLWTPSLTFDDKLLTTDWVLVADEGGIAVGVTAVSGGPREPELSHLWVDPPAMGRGIGRLLFEAAVTHARGSGALRLRIVSDPYAEGFYQALGGQRVGQVASEPAGRKLPVMVLPLD